MQNPNDRAGLTPPLVLNEPYGSDIARGMLYVADRDGGTSAKGGLVKTENAAQPGNDGLVIMPDGTKYVSSVRQGGVSRIRPGESAELIAENIPSAASMCYDAGANQLVILMNPNNGLAFVPLD